MNDEKMIANRIIKLMASKKITQGELAEKIGTSQSSLSRMLKGVKGYRLTPSVVKRICDVLGVDYEDMIAVVESAPTPENNEYEREVMLMWLDHVGVFTTHVKMCDDLVFYCNRETNFMYVCGDRTLTQAEMDEYQKKCHFFSEHYELEFRDRFKKLSVKDYNSIVDALTINNINTLEILFT